MEALVISSAVLLTAVVAAIAAKRSGGSTVTPSAMQLRFPSNVSEAQVRAVLAGLAGLPSRAQVVLDVEATADGVRHVLRAEPGAMDVVGSQLRGVLPEARLEPLAKEDERTWTGGLRLGWSGTHQLLRTEDATAASAALLSGFAPLGEDEALLLRWRLRPARGPFLTGPDGGRPHIAPWWLRLWRVLRPEQTPAASQLGGLRQKYGGPVLHASAVVAVRAGQPDRGWHLAGRVVSALRSRQGQRGRLLVRRQDAEATGRLLEGHGVRAAFVSPGEMAGPVGWPLEGPRLAGLSLGAAPLLMPSPRIPTTGRVLGCSDWPAAQQRLIAQPIVGGLSHLLVAGPSGVGKSNLVARLVADDLANGRGCLVIDGKGDLADQVLGLVPDERRDEVIVLDPGRGGPMPGLRVFGHGDPELTADLIASVLRDLFRSSWGVRSDQWIRAGLVLLGGQPGATLADFGFVFSDDAYRRKLVGRLRDPMALATWAAFESMTPAERAQHLASPLNKINEVVGRRTVRAALAQPNAKLDLRDVMRRGKAVIVRLSAGEIGAPAARLLGALVVHQLFSAVQARAALPASERRPFMAYIDEPRVLGDLPVPLDSLFELARGLGCGMCVSTQSLSQLPKHVSRAIQTNAASIVAFRQSHDDAALLARDLTGVTPEGLMALPAFTAVMRVALSPGDIAAPVTVTTLPPPEPISDPDAVRARSAAAYGVDPEIVDDELRRRHGLDAIDAPDGDAVEASATDAPIGRSRRTS